MSHESREDLYVAVEDPAQPGILALLRAGKELSASLYPAESNHHLPLEALRASHVRFHVARDANGRALGTGAVVLKGDWAEIKRMWVVPDARGRGLTALESAARADGARVLRLETGISNDAALGLYARAGFRPRGPFGDYAPDPLSVFLEKALSGS